MSTTEERLAIAERRIEQLEAALMRRTEALEQKQTELALIKASRIYKFASKVQNGFNRLFPVHTRRRAMVRSVLKSAFGCVKWVFDARAARNGPPPEERYLSEAAPPEEYRRWIHRHEPKPVELAQQRTVRFTRAPKISVVVPIYNPPAKFLEALLKSLTAQTYANWELCAASAGDAPHVKPILEAFAANDSRFHLKYLTANRGIVGNTNAALEMATGDYIAFVDHDDLLAPFALYEVARAIDSDPTIDFLYSDEDKLDTAGVRVEPNFKPDWSPETLRSRNYVCHLTVLKRELLDTIGPLRDGFDGAQDYDLVLRASEKARSIHHIPQVLYHWRMHEQSTASNKSSKSYAFENGRRALVEHLQRLGVDASVHDGPTLGTYQVHYHLRTQPLVSVVIPNRDHPEMLKRCLDSLARGSYAHYEVLIVENGSQLPETHALYREASTDPRVKIVEWTKPFNYAAVNNFAAARSSGELYLFLNNDIESINPDWLEAMVKLAVQPGVGAVGAKLYYADDTIQHAGIVIGMGGVAGHSHLHFPRTAPGHMSRLLYVQNVAAVTGACLLMPKTVFEEVGGFDEGYVLAFNDVDICLQVLAKGHRVVWTPDAELYHLESKTRGAEDTVEKQQRFRREYELFHSKWAAFLKSGDPYYSPHFRLDRPDFALKAS